MPRRKIEIKKIEEKAKLYTTFTKRRKGLFNKASEYCKLFDAEAAMVVFSISDNLFTWGHPTEDKVINDYLTSLMMIQDEEDAAAAAAAGPSSSSDQLQRGAQESAAQEEEAQESSAQEEEERDCSEIDEKLKDITDWLEVVKEKKKERKAISVLRGNADSELFLRL